VENWMIFVLRSERAPSRVLREVDETGVIRTFWLWRHGAWAVVCRLRDGTLTSASSSTLVLRLHTAQGVTVVKVEERPLAPTVPAPVGVVDEEAVSSVHPVAPSPPAIGVEGELEPDGRDVDRARRAQLGGT
jgi:hypothetical protein